VNSIASSGTKRGKTRSRIAPTFFAVELRDPLMRRCYVSTGCGGAAGAAYC
jgi:hypothetical protein